MRQRPRPAVPDEAAVIQDFLELGRVRRNHGRLPSSRCIESAPEQPARTSLFSKRASDTALGLHRSWLPTAAKAAPPRAQSNLMAALRDSASRRTARAESGGPLPKCAGERGPPNILPLSSHDPD